MLQIIKTHLVKLAVVEMNPAVILPAVMVSAEESDG